MTGAAIVVSPAVSTTYTVTGENGGCTGTALSNVTVNALPNVSASAVQDSICIGNSTGINASGGLSYTWGPATGLNTTTGANVVANPTVSTTYTVTGTDGNGCSNSASVIIYVDGCTGAAATVVNTGLKVYPNPNNGSFIIDLPAGSVEEYDIEVHNVLSQLVMKERVLTNGQATSKTIRLPFGTKGVLSLQVSSVQGTFLYRIISE